MRRAVAALHPVHAPIEGRAGKLRLDFNENTLGCSPAVLAALRRATRDEIATYPEYEETRRRLARFFRVAPGELLLTNGADDALRIVADAFLDARSTVLTVEPTFPVYRFYTELAGARRLVLRYDAEMRFPLADVLRALRRRPRVFFLANPNNPTGTLVPRAALRRILAAARRTLVVADEAYAEFSDVSAIAWIRRYPNLVVARTFSKGAGLAGLRMGCLFANRALAALLRRAQPAFPVNRLALVAAEAAARDHAYVRWYVREVLASRATLSAALVRRGVKVFPSGANFVLADFGPRGPAVIRALAQRGILVRDRTADFGRAGFVRITLGTRAQTRTLLRALHLSCRGDLSKSCVVPGVGVEPTWGKIPRGF